MLQGIHILDIYGAIVGTIALVIGIWDLFIDKADYRQDNPCKGCEHKKEEHKDARN